ncbi:hypothetical protein CMESO_237 (nucleomorph) [Chroomonas mesostigmatica CCMP1168]|uniref:Uncharacterized protein n=1 Tax=Chroomonas mesostigmatica CCMP1168 TaxID=1195612 RepID=J7GAA5_9CRYP|nr:hypothetical protein CMESO_237 [Chroomonas mesostigmatica CCMP1168]
MKFILCSHIKIGRLIKIILSSRAKKDSINNFFKKKIFFEILTMGNLNLYIQDKKYNGLIIGCPRYLGLYNKNINFIHKSCSSNILILIFKKFLRFQTLQKNCLSSNKKKIKKINNFLVEKSYVYILDRKNKINKKN